MTMTNYISFMITFDRVIRFSTSGHGLSFRVFLDITILNYSSNYRGNFVATSLMAYNVLQVARCIYVLTIVHCNHFILLFHFEVIQW